DASTPFEFRGLAQRLNALPLYADMGGCILIRPDGTMLFIHSNQKLDADAVSAPLTDRRWRHTALVVGSEKYPELRILLPPRPSDAPDCAACAGKGYISVADINAGCGVCFRLGWIDARMSFDAYGKCVSPWAGGDAFAIQTNSDGELGLAVCDGSCSWGRG